MAPQRPAGRRRPLIAAAVVGLAGHLAFELGARVGLPGSGVVGAGPAAVAFAGASGAAVRRAVRPGTEVDRALALVDGVALAAVAAHLAGWPRRRTRLGLPWLVDCEGLGPDLMRWYNPLLYGPGALAAAALAVEHGPAERRRALLVAAALAPLLVPIQHRDLRSRAARAARRPDRWHRRLAAP